MKKEISKAFRKVARISTYAAEATIPPMITISVVSVIKGELTPKLEKALGVLAAGAGLTLASAIASDLIADITEDEVLNS